MKPTINFFALLIMSFACTVRGQQVPESFADLFVEQNELVEVFLSGESRGYKVNAKVSYDTFKLIDEYNSVTELTQYFTNTKIKQPYVEVAIAQLLAGVESNENCSNENAACLSSIDSNKFEYYYDYEQRRLNVFASSNMFDFLNQDKSYHSTVREHNALINSSNLYVYANDDSNGFTWSNKTLLGLSTGYVDLDTQYNVSNDNLDIRKARYNTDLSGYFASVGYSDHINDSRINSTDYLYYGTDAQGYTALLASSKNLLVKDGYSQHFIYFYAPQAGQMEVFRNGKLLFTDVAKQGRNQISYNELPQGIYTVNIKVKQANSVIVDEVIQVVNKNNIDLKLNEYDFLVRMGLIDFDDVSNGGLQYSGESVFFSEAALNYRLTEKLQLGGVLGSDFDSLRLSAGGQYYFSDDLSMQYVGSASTQGGAYNQGNLSYKSFVLSLLDYKASDVDYNYYYAPYGSPSRSTYHTDYSNALYGNNDRRELGISYSNRLLGGSAYINLYHSSIELFDEVMETDNLSLSWDRKLFGGTFGFNTTYSIDQEGEDNFLTNLSWRYEFDDMYSSRTAVAVNHDGFAYGQQEFTARNSFGDHHVTGTVATKVESYGDRPWTNELMVSGSGSNDYMQYSGFGYASTGEQYSLSGTLRSTQVVTKNEVIATKNNGNSFVKVTPEWSTVPTDDSAIAYSIYKDGVNRHTGEVGAQSSFITSLPEYSDVHIDLDTEYTDVEVDVSSIEHFTVPGSYINVTSRVTPLRSQIFILNDINGQTIHNAKCAGNGCKSVEPVSEDGVYRVVYRENDNFHLVGNGAICVFNPARFGSKYVQSYCLEGLEDMSMQLAYNDSDKEMEQLNTVYNGLVYWGVYKSSNMTLKILERLKELGIASRSVQVDDQLYVYVQHLESHTTAQVSTLNELNTYLVHSKFKSELMFSVTKL